MKKTGTGPNYNRSSNKGTPTEGRTGSPSKNKNAIRNMPENKPDHTKDLDE